MIKLVLVILFLCVIYSSCVIPTYVGKSLLNETEVNKSDSKITNVLLVGAGSTASRLFLENLSPELIKLFARSQIHCDFIYTGKIPRGTHINLETIIAPNYNAYLVINPVDTSYIDTNSPVAIVASPLPGGYGVSGSMIGNKYQEDFYLDLYTSNNLLRKLWEAELTVDFDVSNSSKYVKIAKQIFEKFSKNGFITIVPQKKDIL